VVFLRNLLRAFSYIYETVFCLLAIAVAGAVIVSGTEGLRIGWLPWTDKRLMVAMLIIAVVGLLCVFLAMAGKLRILLFFFSLYVLYLLVSGMFMNMSFSFSGPAEARNGVLVAAGAALAVTGAWPMKVRNRR
jgi:hypothetical protein